jgi:hypothetical protein
MTNKDIDRLDRLLADGWRHPGGLVPGDGWKAGVMAEIRAASAQESPVTNGFSRLFLRVSLVAAAAAVALVIWTVSTGIAAYQELAMKLLEDPASMLLSSPFV